MKKSSGTARTELSIDSNSLQLEDSRHTAIPYHYILPSPSITSLDAILRAKESYAEHFCFMYFFHFFLAPWLTKLGTFSNLRKKGRKRRKERGSSGVECTATLYVIRNAIGGTWLEHCNYTRPLGASFFIDFLFNLVQLILQKTLSAARQQL